MLIPGLEFHHPMSVSTLLRALLSWSPMDRCPLLCIKSPKPLWRFYRGVFLQSLGPRQMAPFRVLQRNAAAQQEGIPAGAQRWRAGAVPAARGGALAGRRLAARLRRHVPPPRPPPPPLPHHSPHPRWLPRKNPPGAPMPTSYIPTTWPSSPPGSRCFCSLLLLFSRCRQSLLLGLKKPCHQVGSA